MAGTHVCDELGLGEWAQELDVILREGGEEGFECAWDGADDAETLARMLQPSERLKEIWDALA